MQADDQSIEAVAGDEAGKEGVFTKFLTQEGGNKLDDGLKKNLTGVKEYIKLKPADLENIQNFYVKLEGVTAQNKKRAALDAFYQEIAKQDKADITQLETIITQALPAGT